MIHSSSADDAQTTILGDFTLSAAQTAAAQARGSDVAVRAGAGTGKTRTLVGRYLSLLADGVPLRGIVAVTFTRKAAWQMRNRIRAVAAAAGEAQGGAWAEIVTALDAVRIGTIHSFCAEILRNHPAEAGIDPRFTTLDETQSRLLLAEAQEAALAWAAARAQPPAAQAALAALGEQGTQKVLQGLLLQRTTAAALLERCRGGDLAAAWAAMLQAARGAQARLLLDDPALAAARERLAAAGGAVPGDLREEARQTAVHALAALAADPDAVGPAWEAAYAALCGISLRGGKASNWPGGKEQMDGVKDDLTLLRDRWQKDAILQARLNDLDEVAAAVLPGLAELFAYAAAAYDDRKEELGALDFDDLEELTIRLLAEHAGARAHWQGVVEALLVDEFQDTNERQRTLFRLLCPAPGKLFIVGDAKQSIYRFRGADVTVFRREVAEIGARQGRVVLLDASYRAHAPLLAGMNDLLAPVLGAEDAARPYHAPFEPLRPAGQETAVLPAPHLELHLGLGRKEDGLPLAAAALLERLLPLLAAGHFAAGDVAILCRASSSFLYYEDALDAAGLPYVTVAGRGFFDRPEVRDLLNALRAVDDPHDDLALAGLLRSPAVGLRDETLLRLRQGCAPEQSLWARAAEAGGQADAGDEEALLQTAVALISSLHSLAGRAGVADVLKQLLDRTSYRAALRRAGQTRALRNVAKLLQDVQRSERINIPAFLEYAAALRDSGSREGEARAGSEGAVQIMTVHQAKGLEFPVVILGDMAYTGPSGGPAFLLDAELGAALRLTDDENKKPGLYELARQREKALADAEDGRLFYVAATRAQQMLFFSGHASLTTKGKLRLGGWLKQLADMCALSDETWPEAALDGPAAHRAERVVGGTPLAVAVYEGGYRTAVSAPPAPPPAPPPAGPFPLLAPLPPPAPARDDEREELTLGPVASTAARPRAPHYILGRLVHDALALWRFPGDGFEPWLAARAREQGLIDRRVVADAVRETSRLLRGFRASQLYADLEAAEQRLHEVHYSLLREDGCVENGRIDLLARSGGVWYVIDFKIDRFGHDQGPQTLPRYGEYVEQVERYVTAVAQLMQKEAKGVLCFLDAPDEYYFYPVA